MKYSKRDVKRIVASLPRIRNIGIPFDSKVGCIVVFADAAQLETDGKAILDRFAVPPLFTHPALREDDGELSARVGAAVVKFDDVRNRVERDVAVQLAPQVQRSAIQVGNAVGRRSRREVFSFSSNPLPNLEPAPALLDENADILARTVNTLADEESVLCYLSRVKSIMWGDPGYTRISDYAQYVHPAVKPEPGDVVCEGGVGQRPLTTLMMAEAVGGAGAVYAFEPVPNFYATAREHVAGHANVTIENTGLWSKEDRMDLYLADNVSTFTPNAAKLEKQKVTCALTSIDIYFRDRAQKPSLIKLDIEGAEAEALDGAAEIIRAGKPKLQVCLYHRLNHFLTLPMRMLRANPKYQLYIGHHTPLNQECVLYAV